MKKIYIIMIVLLILTAAGCTKKDVTKYNYTYKGENDSWSAVYQTAGTVTFTEKKGKLDKERESNEELLLTYKGELTDLSSVRHMEILYETSTGKEKRVTDYETGESIQSKTFSLKSSGKGSAIPIENDIIKVTITLDDDVQSFELKESK